MGENKVTAETKGHETSLIKEVQMVDTPKQGITLVETSFDDDEDCIPSSQTQQSFSQVRSPHVDRKLLCAKIAESPEEKLVQISTLKVVVDDIQTEDLVAGNKENECTNSPLITPQNDSTTTTMIEGGEDLLIKS